MTSKSPSIAIPSSSPARKRPQDLFGDLITSPNQITAGIGEVLQAFVAASTGPSSKPVMIECGGRVMALGRTRMAVMSGRNAFLYLKSKFGLLNSTTPLYIQAAFIGDEEIFVEVDMDAWEELVPHIYRLRIIM